MSTTYLYAATRLALGILQIAGATVALISFIETGASKLTVGAAAITGVIVLVSRALFRKTRSLK